MSDIRVTVPLFTADISAFCKTLRQQLTTAGLVDVPSHLAMLNLVARSAGYRNYQALRANPVAPTSATPPTPQPISPPRDAALSRTAMRALGQFDDAGRLLRWPTQFAVQQLALWALWLRLPTRKSLSEKEVNYYLAAFHLFGDVATLRRELVNAKLLWRTPDCRVYQRVPAKPDATVQPFLSAFLAATKPMTMSANQPGIMS